MCSKLGVSKNYFKIRRENHQIKLFPKAAVWLRQWFTINFNTWWLNCACAGRVDWKSTKVNLTRLDRSFGIWNSKSESEFLKGTKRHRISSGRSEGERKWLIIPSTKLKANLKVSLKFRFHKWILSLWWMGTLSVECQLGVGNWRHGCLIYCVHMCNALWRAQW